MTWVLAGAMLCALWIDRVCGEPPVRWHPVVWMGRYLHALGMHTSRSVGAPARPGVEFWSGMCAWCLGAAVSCAVAVELTLVLRLCAPWLQVVLLGLLLKPLLSWRMLRDEVLAVELALAESLADGRRRVGGLVSRPVDALQAHEVRQAAIATLAENLNDSVVAPLFWFAVAGLPGAAVYRFANTADAMWGYRGERQGRDWTWAGKWAARADDVLSWLPARLTAGLILLSMRACGWRRVAANARSTPSPNSGWPMAALAVGQDIQLGKSEVYCLNPSGRLPVPADTALAVGCCTRVLVGLSWLGIAVCAGSMRGGW